MKRIIVLALSFFGIPVLATAQHSFTLFNASIQHTSGISHVPWYTYDGPAVSIDARYNFDQKNTSALLVGKRFTLLNRENARSTHKDCVSDEFVACESEVDALKVTLTPYVGLLAGDTTGGTVQVVYSLTYRKLDVLVWNQYAWMNQATARDFAYVWLDVGYRVQEHAVVGIGSQKYHERGEPRFYDTGPFVKVLTTQKTSVRLWVTWDPRNSGKRKIFLGLNYTP
jgi:hypothetical protein